MIHSRYTIWLHCDKPLSHFNNESVILLSYFHRSELMQEESDLWCLAISSRANGLSWWHQSSLLATSDSRGADRDVRPPERPCELAAVLRNVVALELFAHKHTSSTTILNASLLQPLVRRQNSNYTRNDNCTETHNHNTVNTTKMTKSIKHKT